MVSLEVLISLSHYKYLDAVIVKRPEHSLDSHYMRLAAALGATITSEEILAR